MLSLVYTGIEALEGERAMVFYQHKSPELHYLGIIHFPLHLLLLLPILYPKMSTPGTLDFKSSTLIISLVLVPIVILICALALALACSEFWSSRPSDFSCFRCCSRRKTEQRRRNNNSDPRSSDSTEASGTFTPFDYGNPILPREHV